MDKLISKFLLLSALVFASCNSDQLNFLDTDLNILVEEFNCEQFAYPDTLFYINGAAENKIIPVQNLNGVFRAVPEGLALDSLSGEIDINASETGLRYKLTFTPANSIQACDFEIVISGVNYLDKVYIMDQNEKFALPIFNANAAAISPCDDDDDDDDDGDDDDDDDDDCEFDVNGPNGNKLSDLGIEINSATGAIDLQKALDNKAFGVNPSNASTLEGKLYYKLNDNSLKAQNSIDLKFFYFETLADVPQSLLDEIEEKNKQTLGIELPKTNSNARLATENTKGKPRPPFLIIVARIE